VCSRRAGFLSTAANAGPQTFVVRHASDAAAYKAIDELNREHTHWSNA
jgi:hypothetical protein